VSEKDDHQFPLDALARWDIAETPFHWTPDTHVRCFPCGVEFQVVSPEPGSLSAWRAGDSLADTMGAIEHRPPEALLWTLARNGERVGKPWRLRGPFHVLHEDGKLTSITAHGGTIERHEPQVLIGQSVRIIPLDAEGKQAGPGRVMQGVVDVMVSLRPVVEDTAVAIGHLAHATIAATAQLKRFAYSRILNAFYVADRVLTWTRDGRRLWVHRSWVRPGPAMGLTRRQKRAQRRIHRRGTR
jgi:hypothetical protein